MIGETGYGESGKSSKALIALGGFLVGVIVMVVVAALLLQGVEAEKSRLWVDGALYFNHLQMREDLKDYNLGVAYKRFSARYFALLLQFNDQNLNESVYWLDKCLKREGNQVACQPFFQRIDNRVFDLMGERYADSNFFKSDPLEWREVSGEE